MRRFRIEFVNALAATVVASACPQALAQAVTPGQVNESLKPTPDLTPPPQPEVQLDTPAPVRVVPVVPASEALLVVKTFEFTGNALFSERHLSDQLKSYIGRRVTLADLYEAADRIAAFYNDQGYTLATVNLPPQKVSDGKVLLQISEGRVASVVIDGNERYQAEHLRRYLGAFRAGEIYRAESLQQGLRSLSALPGLSVKATVRPGEAARSCWPWTNVRCRAA